ncbi:MAG: DNA repair protein RecO [Candidatus Omnitrophota bacterium]
MAIQKTQALLLSRKETRETSCIVSFYTQDFGKIKGLIKGVRGPNAVFGAYLHEFADYDIVYYEKKRKDIYTISECDLKEAFKQLNIDLERRLWAYYMVELVDKLTPLEDKNSRIYLLLLETLKSLNSEHFIDKVVMAFQINFLKLLGLMPQLEACVNCESPLMRQGNFSVRFGGLLCGKCLGADVQSFAVSDGAVASMRMLAKTQTPNLSRISISRDLRKQISELLERFIDYQLGEHLKSARFIKAVGIGA